MNPLTQTIAEMLAEALNEDGSGAWSASQQSFNAMLAAAHNVITGGSASHLTSSRLQLIEAIALEVSASVSRLTHSEPQMLAAIANAEGASVSHLTRSLSELWSDALSMMIQSGRFGGGGGGAPGESHRYWRIRSTDTNVAGEYMACTELEMRATSGGADLTTGETATASANAGASYVPGKAIDDDTGSFWSTGIAAQPSIGHWLQIDFGAAGDVFVDEISYKARPDTIREDPNNLYIESSDDAVSWTLEWYVTGIGTWTDGETKVFTRPALSVSDVSGTPRIGQTGTLDLTSKIVVNGGHSPFTYSIVSGSLPAGVSLNSSTGVLTSSGASLGTTSGLVLRVTDVNSVYDDTASFSLTVAQGYRYIGYRADSTGNDYTSCAKMELQLGGVDLATGGTAAMDNNHASYPASNAFDSDIATFALANPSPPTALYYDFGSGASIVIDAVAWTARDDAFGPAEQPITGKIVAKQNSGDAWTELADPGTQSAWAQGERRVWAI